MVLASCQDDSRTPWPKTPEQPVRPERPAEYEASISSSLCVMPVKDGAPTAADVHQAFRMVFKVEMLPGQPSPWIKALNRGGEWTIDAEGRYAPFEGPAPDNGLGLDYVVETDGRIVGVSGGQLLVRRRDESRFRPIIRLDEHDTPFAAAALARLPDADVTLVSDKQTTRILSGERLVEWPEAGRMQAAGLRRFIRALPIPEADATLFEGPDGALAVRFRGGAWIGLGRLDPDAKSPSNADYLVKAEYAAHAQGVLVTTAERFLLLKLGPVSAPSARLSVLAARDKSRDRSGRQVFFSSSAGEIITYRDTAPDKAAEWARLGPQRPSIPRGDFSKIQAQPRRDLGPPGRSAGPQGVRVPLAGRRVRLRERQHQGRAGRARRRDRPSCDAGQPAPIEPHTRQLGRRRLRDQAG